MTVMEVDYKFATPETDLGGITRAEVIGRGRIYQLIDEDTVALMESRVRKTGILEKLEEWRREDGLVTGLGGRPSLISDRAVLTGLLLLANEKAAMFITNLTALFQYRLHDASRELLELEPATGDYVGHTGEQSRWYHNTHRAFQRINALTDPFPQDRRKAKTYTEIQEILANHDHALEKKRKARLDEFTKLFLVMTFNEQPRAIRRASKKIDISFDQTYIQTPTTKGYSKKTLAKRVADETKAADTKTLTPGPVDAFAGWHVTSGPRTDVPTGQPDLTTPKTKGSFSDSESKWGWVANIAARVDSESPENPRFPMLAVAATLSLPNVRVAEEAVSLMKASKATELQPGIGDADKQYWANSLAKRLHDPAFNEGFTPSTDYRIDRLGVQGGDHGALYIEGGAYCPGIPKAHQDATKDYKSGKIDHATYRERIKERKAFQLHQKERPDAKGRVVLQCPALGPSPTVTCALREFAKSIAKKERPSVDEADIPDFLDKICIQHSVSFNTAGMRRQKQAFQYGSPEWEEFHQYARNSIESLNSQIKAGGEEDLASAKRRRVRGLGAAQMMFTILTASFNLRKIAAFISDRIKADAKKLTTGPVIRKVRRRDREWHNPYTGTYPPGVIPPGKPQPPAPSDETGGPPPRT